MPALVQRLCMTRCEKDSNRLQSHQGKDTARPCSDYGTPWFHITNAEVENEKNYTKTHKNTYYSSTKIQSHEIITTSTECIYLDTDKSA